MNAFNILFVGGDYENKMIFYCIWSLFNDINDAVAHIFKTIQKWNGTQLQNVEKQTTNATFPTHDLGK